MTKKEAQKIARHLDSAVFVTAANHTGKTWGFNVACGSRRYTTQNGRNYNDAQKHRSESIAEMIDHLIEGNAPEWMSEAFKW